MSTAPFTIVGHLGDFRLDKTGLWFVKTRIEATLAEDDEDMFRNPYFGAVVGEREPVRAIALDRMNHPGVMNPCADGDLYLVSSPTAADLIARLTRMCKTLHGGRASILACARTGHEGDLTSHSSIQRLAAA